jgi:murein DD-endopeptidase MepM/ murein hydrolase activator NlpD
MKITKRLLSLVLAMAILSGAFAVPAFAASHWPSLSSSGYCEMVAPVNLPVYRNTDLTTRGTSSPARSYNAYIEKNDKIYIYKITDSYAQISYPTSSGRRTGYVKTSSLLGVTAPYETVTSRAKVTTYTGASTAVRSGNTAVGDTVYKLGSTSSGYVLIIYTAKSGSRSFKAAFVTKNDYTKILGNGTVNTDAQAMSYALYKSSGGRLSCSFDGYTTTRGRHEGIDFAKGYGSAVYSLTDGVITRITEGYNGTYGLSTIAVYYAAADKTIVYLHTDPLNSLKEGQTIVRGQQIATEAWRGVSSANGTHTHVEVRNGYRVGAAKSVNDYTLDNPNPTSFWNSLGYQVK